MCDKKAIRCAGLCVGIFCFRAETKKATLRARLRVGIFLFSCGNEKATLRARLRVALKFLKLTAFVNEILWWAHRDSLARRRYAGCGAFVTI